MAAESDEGGKNTFVRLGEGSPTPTEQDDGIENEDMGAENEDEPFPDGDIYLADDEDSDYDPSTQPETLPPNEGSELPTPSNEGNEVNTYNVENEDEEGNDEQSSDADVYSGNVEDETEGDVMMEDPNAGLQIEEQLGGVIIDQIQHAIGQVHLLVMSVDASEAMPEV